MSTYATSPGVTPERRAAALGARLDALLVAGDVGGACSLVSAEFANRSDAGNLPEIAALLSALPDSQLGAHAGVLLELARACDAEARIRLRTRLLERAERLASVVADPIGFELALRAERIADLARDTDGKVVQERVEELLSLIEREVSRSDATYLREARARSSYALARVLAWRGDPASLAAAEDAVHAAAGYARELGRREWRAQALLTLGYSIYFERGEELRAIQRLREAIDLLPPGHPRRAGVATFLADVYVRSHVGDAADAVLDDIRTEAAETGDQRSLGYAAWILGLLSCERGDRDGTLEWLAEAERHPGDWFAHPTGSEFLAEAAVCAERVGAIAAADGYLERARARAVADGYPEISWLANGVINARRGDPEVAIAELSHLIGEPWLPLRDAWKVWLHLALARLRSGDEQGAAQDAARGFEAASALVGPGRAAATRAELPGVLTRLEPDLVRRVAPSAARVGSIVAEAIEPPHPRVCLFGGLDIQVDGASVTVPPGRPALLLMLVAMARRPVSIDAALDELWPDVAGEVGRRRIRNVLARIKAACGDLLVRRGDSLVLAAGTAVDIGEFVDACDRVDRAIPADRPALARAALAMHHAEILPEAAYTPSVMRMRNDLNRRTVALLELVADDAERVGRADDAVAAMTRWCELDPYDPAVPTRLAAMLIRLGRPEQADAWRTRARGLEAGDRSPRLP